MASITCKCGNRLSNSLVPNGIQYYVFSDTEWDGILMNDTVHTMDIPRPKNDIWMCDNCQRIIIFDDNGKVVRVYAVEADSSAE